MLLTDIRTVFLTKGVDRISSADLVEALLGLDDGMWRTCAVRTTTGRRAS